MRLPWLMSLATIFGAFQTSPEGPESISYCKITSTKVTCVWPSSDVLQHGFKVLPEALHGRYLHPFVRAVGIDDGRTERHHLHPGIFFADHAALQAGVHSDQLGRFTEELLVYCLQLAHDLAVRLGLPSGVASRVLHFEPR